MTAMQNMLIRIFGDAGHASDLSWHQIAARSCIIYFAGLVLVRLGKSRLLSRASPLDVILAFMLGSILSRGVMGTSPLVATIVAAAVLVGLHWVFSALAYHSKWCGWLIKGSSYELVSHGEINWANMRRSHITEDDLREHARLRANLNDLTSVEYAIKERSGEVGIVPKPRTLRTEVTIEKGVQVIRLIISN